MPDARTRQRLYWICQFTAWTIYAVLNTLLINAYSRLPLAVNVGLLSYGLCGICVTHLLRAHIRRQGLVSRPWRDIFLHTALMIPIGAIALTFLINVCWYLLTRSVATSNQVSFSSILFGILFNMCFLIAIWLLIYFTVHIVWRSIALREAQLTALQSQINPHFLFNSLNSLRGLILENPAAAQDAVTRLSQLMRYSLTQSRRPTVPLREEIAAIRDYLAIEKIRFEERLNIIWQIDPDLESVEVPPMCLQTLVENALKHGIANLPAGGTVQISATRTPSSLTLQVTSPGSLSLSPAPSTGTGLRNTRERLQLLSGPRASLRLSETAGLVNATIEIPA